MIKITKTAAWVLIVIGSLSLFVGVVNGYGQAALGWEKDFMPALNVGMGSAFLMFGILWRNMIKFLEKNEY